MDNKSHTQKNVRWNYTCPFPNFSGAAVEVWEWISNFISYFTGHVINFPCYEDYGSAISFPDIETHACECKHGPAHAAIQFTIYETVTETHHYDDVIMTTIASQITSLAVVYSTVYSDADQRKHQSSASLAFVWGIHRDRWIPRTKGQLHGKCFHLMTSSCAYMIDH